MWINHNHVEYDEKYSHITISSHNDIDKHEIYNIKINDNKSS